MAEGLLADMSRPCPLLELTSRKIKHLDTDMVTARNNVGLIRQLVFDVLSYVFLRYDSRKVESPENSHLIDIFPKGRKV